jgi:hypothetical protein
MGNARQWFWKKISEVRSGEWVQAIATLIGLTAGLWLGFHTLGETLARQDIMYLDEKADRISGILHNKPYISCVYGFKIGKSDLDLGCSSAISSFDDLRSVLLYAEAVMVYMCEMRDVIEDDDEYEFWYGRYVAETKHDPLGVFRFVTDESEKCQKPLLDMCETKRAESDDGLPRDCHAWIREGEDKVLNLAQSIQEKAG